jgi:hypothetical protein
VIDPTSQLKFHLGGPDLSGKTVWIDFVVVTEVETPIPVAYSFQLLDGSVTGIT